MGHGHLLTALGTARLLHRFTNDAGRVLRTSTPKKAPSRNVDEPDLK
jgi:hypothetical protein